jgi:hypothetical protein
MSFAGMLSYVLLTKKPSFEGDVRLARNSCQAAFACAPRR